MQMTQDQDRIDAMERLCAGMTTAELRDAPFTYQSLLQIVQRREDRVPLSALVLPDIYDNDQCDDYLEGRNDAIRELKQQINQLMEQPK
jgi:hypothetical protein